MMDIIQWLLSADPYVAHATAYRSDTRHSMTGGVKKSCSALSIEG